LRSLGGNASSRALLVLDGVPQSDPFGGWVNWPAYDPAGLSQVRVVRGGGSVAYGPGALAGVIDMTSFNGTGTNSSIEAGSRNSIGGHAYVGASAGQGLFTLDAQGARSDGFSPVTKGTRGPVDRAAPYKEGSARARWLAPIGKDIELQASGLGFIDVRQRGVPFTGNRTRGLDTSLRLVGSRRWEWSATAYAQWRNFRSSFASVNDDRTDAQRVALQYSVPSRGLGGSIEVRPPLGDSVELRLGADARFTTGETREFFSYVAGQPMRRRHAGGDTSTQGLFAEANLTTGPLALSGGARLDHWTISNGKLVETQIATGQGLRDDRFADRSGWRPTARAGAVYDAGGGFSVRSAAYLGWRIPTLNELFRPFRAGPDATAANPLLKPERLSGAEAGIRYARAGVELQLTGFVNRLSDAIANVTIGHGPGQFPGVGFVAGNFSQRQNLDAVKVKGLELSGQLNRGPWLFRLAASLTRARVNSNGLAVALDGLRPAQTPALGVTGELAWSDRGRSASIQVRRVGNQFEDDLNSLRLPGATSVDAFFAWPVAPRLQLIARAQNLLDSNVLAGRDSDGTLERATPRTLWVGLRLSSF
jgi:outer membrane receptor protein involved in Fe transport